MVNNQILKMISLSQRDSWILYLDDERNPQTNRPWTIARTVSDAKNLVMTKGAPDFISFDHDIDENGTGMDFAKWLIDMDMDGKIELGPDFDWIIHSANPVGSKNIQGILESYMRFKNAARI